MGIGHLTKQLAQQAIGNQVKEVVDSLRPGEAAAEARPAATGPGAFILNELQAMQKALKDDEELVVTCAAAGQIIRVLDIILPSPGVAVLSGIDPERATTRVISALDALQLACKPRNVQPPAKPHRIRFVTPKQP